MHGGVCYASSYEGVSVVQVDVDLCASGCMVMSGMQTAAWWCLVCKVLHSGV